MPTISVIIPLFNKAAYVESALVALASQLQAGDEIVVVDDVSTDDGPARVERLAAALPDTHLRLLRQARNGGPATARNAGAADARGDYLLFFDADDIPHPQLMAPLRQCIARHPSESMFTYDLALQAHGETADMAPAQALANVSTEVLLPGAFVRASLMGKPLCTASSTCVRTKAFQAAGGFQPGLRYCEDPELWARLSARHAIVRIGATLAVYRDVPASLSHGMRAQPGSVQPYVATLLSLSQHPGDEHQRLACSFVTRNVVFSLALGARRMAVLGYLSSVRALFRWDRLLALRLLAALPRSVLSLALRWRTRRLGRRHLSRAAP